MSKTAAIAKVDEILIDLEACWAGSMLSRKHVEQEGVAVVVDGDDAIDAEVHAVVFDDDVAGVEEVVDVKVPICRPHALVRSICLNDTSSRKLCSCRQIFRSLGTMPPH